MTSELAFENFRILASLGVTEVERKIPQWIRIDFRFRFSSVPAAAMTDQIDDTLCYSEILERIRHLISNREFQTIEFLNRELLESIRPSLELPGELTLKVTKEKPPVDGLAGGASFLICEEVR